MIRDGNQVLIMKVSLFIKMLKISVLNIHALSLLFFHKQPNKDNFMETEESKELTLAQEETIKKTLEEIRKQDPKKNKRVYPIVVFGDEYDDKDVYIAYFREPDFIAFSKFVQLQKKDEIAAVRSLAHDTFIQGDKELVDDDSLFLYGLSTKLVNIIGSRQAKVANFSIAGK